MPGEALLVDASVVLKWFMPPEREPLVEEARRLIGGGPLRTTTLAVYEVANILVRTSGLGPKEIGRALGTLDDLCGEPLGLTPEDRTQATELALHHDITFYDASYAAIATRAGLTLISADADLTDPGLARALG